jgi:hypothetical protein
MDNYRETKEVNLQRAKGVPGFSPITSLSRDHRASIFVRTRSRSVNSPEVKIAHQALTEWLNGENSWEEIDSNYRNTPESTERIRQLFELVTRVVAEFERQAPVLYPHFYATPKSEDHGREKGLIVLFGEISRAIADYATVPYLAFQPSSKTWGVGHWPAESAGAQGSGTIHSIRPIHRPYGEVMAAHGILELVRNNALTRIRRCDCGRWFFALRIDGVACSDTCRKRIHDQKPEVKKRRKDKAKNNSDYTSGLIHVKKLQVKRRAQRKGL